MEKPSCCMACALTASAAAVGETQQGAIMTNARPAALAERRGDPRSGAAAVVASGARRTGDVVREGRGIRPAFPGALPRAVREAARGGLASGAKRPKGAWRSSFCSINFRAMRSAARRACMQPTRWRAAIAIARDRRRPRSGRGAGAAAVLLSTVRPLREPGRSGSRGRARRGRLGEPALSTPSGHRDIIRRFGRFPHRNPILGRAMTEDEQRDRGQRRIQGLTGTCLSRT